MTHLPPDQGVRRSASRRRIGLTVAALLLIVGVDTTAVLSAGPGHSTAPAANPPRDPSSGPTHRRSPTPRPSTGATAVHPPPTTSVTSAPPPDPTARPNVVFILTDDENVPEMDVMPKTRRLIGTTGTTFTRALSQYPLCCPARATLLTGQEAHNHHVLGNDPPWGGYPAFDESSTLPIWLQDAGYQTGIVGKYLNGYPLARDPLHVAPGWDEWHVPVRGIYNYDAFAMNDNGTVHVKREYQSDYTGTEASDLIEQFHASDQPFYIWAGFLAPHSGGPIEPDDPVVADPHTAVPLTPAVADKYRDTEDDDLMPAKPSRPELDVSDKDKFIRRAPIDRADLQEFYSQRREALRSVDDNVAKIVHTLARTGELDNTLIIFASDNGYLIGEHNINNKIYGYEESIRVPLLMSGPGISSGVEANQLVSLTDVAPTILQATGATPGLTQDGLALQPFTHDPTYMAHRDLLLEAGGWPFPKLDRLYQGVRTWDDLVYLHWYDDFDEVYDLKTDPYELDGTVNTAEERRQLSSLRDRLQRLKACVGMACNAY